MRMTLLAAASLAMTAATGATAAPVTRAPTFVTCEDAGVGPLAGSQCAVVKAPLRHGDPASGDIELFIRRFPPVGESRGDVWLIAGGPGESGASLYAVIDQLRAAFPNRTLIIPDHRGTGRSSRVCVEEESPGSAGGRDLAGAEWASCFGALQARTAWTQSFTIDNAARDLSGLIAEGSAGRETYVYGVSYGTQLVLRMMTVAPPAALKGIVLDSLVPPETTQVWDLSHRSQVVDAVGRGVLADCDRRPDCSSRLGRPAAQALRAIIDDPARAALFPGGDPKAFLGALLDSPDARALIPEIIVDAGAGRGEAIAAAAARLDAFVAPFVAVEAQSSIPLVALISASENNARTGLTAADVAAEAEGLLFTSSLPAQLLGGAAMAYPRSPVHGVSATRLPPVQVLQGDRDPKTPLAGALAHAALLEAAGPVRFVTAVGAAHFVVLTRPACAVEAIGGFVAGDAGNDLPACR